MRKLRVVTNESFERYISYLSLKDKFESTNRRIKFEDRFSGLDLDDITADVTAPTDGEIDAAIRDLDIFDDAAAKSGAKNIEVAPDGGLRLLDLDEPVKNNKSKNEPEDDKRFADLDLDQSGNQNSSSSNDDDSIRELDFDEPVEVKDKKSNIGNVIGRLDYDDDIDTSELVASIDDVYTALASDNANVVKSIIKRYAPDIKDKDKIRDVMLVHATNLNLPCLRALCGDMKIALTAKEKSLEYIDKNDIKSALERFKSIASSLTGSNNTYGLIPNAIVSCTQDNQIKCMNVVDFLKEWCSLPIIPLYFRGAMIRHCYDLADYLLDEINNELPLDILTGSKGLINRMKALDDIPSSLLSKIVAIIVKMKGINLSVLGDTIIALSRNNDKTSIKKVFSTLSKVKLDIITDYIEDIDAAAYDYVDNIINN
jgi:hypothetical protein